MNLKKKLIGINTLLVFSMALTACGPTVTPAPTIDVNMLFTQAAQTVVAQMTKNAPTVTPTLAATNTPLPSKTPLGGAFPTLPALATLPPLATSTSQAYNGPDKAAYITQSPSDNTSVKTGQVFNIIWRLRNTGTTTWTTNYVYRFYSAINKLSTSANGYNLPAAVPPNGEVELKVVATAPTSTGTYDTRWVLTNAEGTNFSNFDLTVNVIQGTTSNASEPTAAAAPNSCEIIVQDGNPKTITAAKTWSVNGNQIVLYFTKAAAPGVDFTVTIDGKTPEQGGSYNTYSSANALYLSYHADGHPTADKDPHEFIVTPSGSMEILGVSAISSNTYCF
jgi:hypothetical protein